MTLIGIVGKPYVVDASVRTTHRRPNGFREDVLCWVDSDRVLVHPSRFGEFLSISAEIRDTGEIPERAVVIRPLLGTVP